MREKLKKILVGALFVTYLAGGGTAIYRYMNNYSEDDVMRPILYSLMISVPFEFALINEKKENELEKKIKKESS